MSDLTPFHPPRLQRAKKFEEHITMAPINSTSSQPDKVASKMHIDPFEHTGNAGSGELDFKTLSWWQCSLLMVAETISLGILALPSIVAKMGALPGALLIFAFGVIATYTGFIIGQFKQRYPHIHSFADAGFMLGGKTGEMVIHVMQTIVFLFIMAAHVLAFMIMMNVLTGHAACTVIWSVIGTFLSMLLTLPRTLKKISLLSTFSCLSITLAVIVTMAAVGIQKPDPTSAVLIVPFNAGTLQAYALGISNIVIAFTGHTAYFGFISELRRPTDFNKSLALLQTLSITFYVTVALVTYHYAGATVASPALGSAPPLLRTVAYAIAAPTVVVAGVVNAHICVKNVHVRLWRGTDALTTRSPTGRAATSWYGLCAAAWLAAFVVANAIPVFNELLGLLGAMFCSWFSLGFPAVFWLYVNRARWADGWGKVALTGLNVAIFVLGLFVCVYGTWGAAVAIADSATDAKPFSCADNSL